MTAQSVTDKLYEKADKQLAADTQELINKIVTFLNGEVPVFNLTVRWRDKEHLCWHVQEGEVGCYDMMQAIRATLFKARQDAYRNKAVLEFMNRVEELELQIKEIQDE